MRNRSIVVVLTALALLVLTPSFAFAFKEGGASRALCVDCHGAKSLVSGSLPSTSTADTSTVTGPHMGYTATSRKCQSCHQVHDALAPQLLPDATIVGTCNVCHDGTGGGGVYGVLSQRGVTPGAKHRIGVTRTVPGGDAATGDSAEMVFSAKPNNYLTCTDCHTPHGQSVVAAFTGDRERTASDIATPTPIYSTRLLMKRPGGIGYDINEYGSNWCASCHAGRLAITPLHNHPVATDTIATYDHLIRMASDAMGSATVNGSLGGSNRGYVMTNATVTWLADRGSGPICQQCHEDSRNVGQMDGTGANAQPAAFTITNLDGLGVTDNPRFQVFPHESENRRFLVETDDNLCYGNCHRVLP
jgi:hypothetical protein